MVPSTNKKRSVLHLGKFYPPHRGGMETYLSNLATRHVSTIGVQVIVANNGWRNQEGVIDGINVKRIGKIATVASMPVCPGLLQAIRGCPADLVHIHTPNPGAAWAFLKSGHQGRVVITHHADTLGREILRKFSDPFVYRLMQRADAIIVTSNRYLDSSRELAPFRWKCRVIPIGVDIPKGTATRGSVGEQLRKQFGEKLLLAIGRLVPYKGFDVLIRAMKQVDAHLVLVGDGPEREPLRKIAREERVEGKVTMIGYAEHLSEFFNVASMFVLPSVTRAEAYGIVQIEAMAAGIPVINTEINSGVPEVSLNGVTGLSVEPRNASALADAIKLLMDRKDLRVKFGQAGRMRVYKEFNADLMAQRTMAVYNEVLKSIGMRLGA